jgi:Flp pilus assembly pilin Flp
MWLPNAPRQPHINFVREGGEQHMARVYALIHSIFVPDEEGQGLAEYSLLLSLIAIVAIGALFFLGGDVKTLLSTVGKSI